MRLYTGRHRLYAGTDLHARSLYVHVLDKSVDCAYDPATRAAAFRTLDTGRADCERFFRAHPGALVVVEAGTNAGWAADLAGIEDRTTASRPSFAAVVRIAKALGKDCTAVAV